METIKTIFNNRIFRIPDYQRGYSWERTHLEDFWQDISNLQKKKVHYTGMISVEAVEENEYSKWESDQWIIKGKGDTPYFIVDGQQRITTLIILIWVICQKMPINGQLNYHSREEIINKYIFTKNKLGNEKSYLFGYHKDNPSYEFLKREIFEQLDDSTSKIEETVYTNNLLNAKRYFTDKIRKHNLDELENLFDKITQQLKFDFKELEKELDIFIVFETMNNRGKPLSNLEKLKNRLIYLSTLLKNDSDEKKYQLRNNINENWKIIYKYLGLNKEQKLDDDSFLQNHWIMYKRYDRREPEFYANDIFNRYYTSQNAISGKQDFESINNYIESLALSVKQWFVMNSPTHPHAFEITNSDAIIDWLTKLNRLGLKSFSPLIMGVLVVENDKQKIIRLLKSVESYIFLIFSVSFRRSNTGTYHFFAKASELYNNEISTEDIINDIALWIYGKEDYKGYFDISGFYSFLKDLFLRDNTNGYFDWKFLKYFLYEFDLESSKEENFQQLPYNGTSTVQHIYPSSPLLTSWQNHFSDISNRNLRFIAGNLGNYVLVNKNLDEQASFDTKKNAYRNFGNSNDVSKYSEWTAETIYQRGIKMLEFMEKRWNIEIDLEDKQRLLFIDGV